MWSAMWESFGGEKVENMCGDMKCFDLECGGQSCLEKKGTDDIICGANHLLCFTILL